MWTPTYTATCMCTILLWTEGVQRFLQLCRVKVPCDNARSQGPLQEDQPQLAVLYLLVDGHDVHELLHCHAGLRLDWQLAAFQQCHRPARSTVYCKQGPLSLLERLCSAVQELQVHSAEPAPRSRTKPAASRAQYQTSSLSHAAPN